MAHVPEVTWLGPSGRRGASPTPDGLPDRNKPNSGRRVLIKLAAITPLCLFFLITAVRRTVRCRLPQPWRQLTGGRCARGTDHLVTLRSVSCPSATLVVWTSAWLHGAAAADDVLDALQSWADLHEVVAQDSGTADLLELPTAPEKPASPALLLAALRRVGIVGGELVLPTAGDFRGLRGHAPFAAAALHAGEAAVLRAEGDAIPADQTDFGLVPERVADGVVRWTVLRLPAAPGVEHLPIGEAEFELSGAMRAAATALVELDVARHRPGVRAEISALVEKQPSIPWPPGMPNRALRVLQRANEVAAILQVAMSDAPGGALSASAMRRRAEALRPLDDAVRTARQTAVAEAVRALSDHAGKC